MTRPHGPGFTRRIAAWIRRPAPLEGEQGVPRGVAWQRSRHRWRRACTPPVQAFFLLQRRLRDWRFQAGSCQRWNSGRADTSPVTRSVARPSSRTTSKLLRYRSEEHSSELQSPCNLVCRLLLEKKKNLIISTATYCDLL